jgi:hypothetical protein
MSTNILVIFTLKSWLVIAEVISIVKTLFRMLSFQCISFPKGYYSISSSKTMRLSFVTKYIFLDEKKTTTRFDKNNPFSCIWYNS